MSVMTAIAEIISRLISKKITNDFLRATPKGNSPRSRYSSRRPTNAITAIPPIRITLTKAFNSSASPCTLSIRLRPVHGFNFLTSNFKDSELKFQPPITKGPMNVETNIKIMNGVIIKTVAKNKLDSNSTVA